MAYGDVGGAVTEPASKSSPLASGRRPPRTAAWSRRTTTVCDQATGLPAASSAARDWLHGAGPVEVVLDVVLARPDHLDRRARRPCDAWTASTTKSSSKRRPKPPPRKVVWTVTCSPAGRRAWRRCPARRVRRRTGTGSAPRRCTCPASHRGRCSSSAPCRRAPGTAPRRPPRPSCRAGGSAAAASPSLRGGDARACATSAASLADDVGAR